MRYRAFISYSHAADKQLAPALQVALQGFGKPFFKIRALKVFRDGTDLRMTPHLWPVIQEALRESDYFILLASPDSARSEWVRREIEEWLGANDSDVSHFLIAITEGTIEWDGSAGDFDWRRTDALPPMLQGRFRHEPLYLDLRSVRTTSDLSLRNPDFLDAVATIAATLYDKSKDDLVGVEIRRHRIFRAAVGMTMTLLLALSVAAAGGFVTARREQTRAEQAANRAIANQHAANGQRKIALDARNKERDERQRADRSRELANQQRDLAVEALTTLIFDAQDLLGEVPKSREVRKSLLALAAQKLNDVDTSSQEVSAEVRRHGAVALSKLADNMRELGDYADALDHYERSLAQFRKLLAEKPGDLNLRVSVWMTLSKRADVALMEYEFDLAERSYREALRIVEALAREHPGRLDLQRFLALSWGKIADTHGRQVTIVDGRPVSPGLPEARKYWTRALAIYEKLRRRQPRDQSLIHDSLIAMGRLAAIHREMGDTAAAEDYVRRGYELVAAHEPPRRIMPGQASDLAVSMRDMADLAVQKGDFAAARSFAQKAVELRFSLHKYDEEDFEAAVAMVMSFDRLGRIEEADERYEEAMRYYQIALKNLERLPINDPEHDRAELRLTLSLLAERIDACRKALGAPTE